MGWITLGLDGTIAVLLVTLATRLLFTRNLFEAIVLFVAYGLTLSLAWIRIGAPDVALAEAALGAGVTGALFLNTFQRLAEGVKDDAGEIASGRPDENEGPSSSRAES